MNKIVLSIILGFLVISPLTAATAQKAISFGELFDNVDKRKNTKLHAQEYWKSVKGAEVTWGGEVVDVDGGGSKVKILIADKTRPTYKGYNIVIITYDIAKAANLKKGQRIRFKGVVTDYDSKDSGAVIELKEAQIL
jgi:hypothetical protein